MTFSTVMTAYDYLLDAVGGWAVLASATRSELAGLVAVASD